MLRLPKPHLSWTQIDLWDKSPRQYSKIYFEGKRMYVSPEMRFGKEFDESLESGNILEADPRFFEAISATERMDYYQFPCAIQRMGYYILGFMDGATRDLTTIHEYKTGKTPWNEKRVDNHGQLKIYSEAARRITGKIPVCELIWYQTKGKGEEIEFTGKIQAFKKKFKRKELTEFIEYCDSVAEDISYHYNFFNQQIV